MRLTIAVDSVLRLPDGAVYTHGSGRAQVTVGKGAKPGTVVVRATCDSLARLVAYYEDRVSRIRGDTIDNVYTVETVKERRTNSVRTILVTFTAGLALGTVITIITMRRHGK